LNTLIRAFKRKSSQVSFRFETKSSAMNLRLMNDEVLTALHMLAQTIDEVNSQVTLCLTVLIDGERDHRG